MKSLQSPPGFASGFLCSLAFGAIVLVCGIVVRANSWFTTPTSTHHPSTTDPATNNVAFPDHLYDVNVNEYPCQPKRLHIAQATNVDSSDHVSMTVSFMLEDSCRGAIPSIMYGQGFLDKGVVTVVDPPLQFNYSSKHSNGVFVSDLIYHVELPDLQADHQYWYRIVVKWPSRATTTIMSSSTTRLLRPASNEILVGETSTYRFWTPPLPGSPTTIALIGDLGQTDNSMRTMMHIWKAAVGTKSKTNIPASHLIIAGDMSYADSDPYRWISWFDRMEPLLRMLPTHVAAGNHEIECNTATNEIFVPYEMYFHNPNRIQTAEMRPITEQYRSTLWEGSCSAPSAFLGHYIYGNSFYAYQHGLVHVIVLNSYTYTTQGSPQYNWFQHELEYNFNRQQTPWLLVTFHAPLYTTFMGHVDEVQSQQMKKAMEPLLLQYGVNFVVVGHDHAYLRTRSLRYGQVDATGKSPIYLTLGAGGNREGHAPGFLDDTVPEDWVATRTLQDYGYGHLFVPNATHAYFTWVRDGLDLNDTFQDHVWVVNKHV